MQIDLFCDRSHLPVADDVHRFRLAAHVSTYHTKPFGSQRSERLGLRHVNLSTKEVASAAGRQLCRGGGTNTLGQLQLPADGHLDILRHSRRSCFSTRGISSHKGCRSEPICCVDDASSLGSFRWERGVAGSISKPSHICALQ